MRNRTPGSPFHGGGNAAGVYLQVVFSFTKLTGVGLALTVLLDATLIRAVLMPAAMWIMGDRNWWAPTPLRKLHARIEIREDVSVGA